MKSRAGKLLFGAIAVLWASMLAATRAAADEGWVITSFASSIDVHSDSSLSIVEDVHVDFGSLQKHGIFRHIPVRYSYDSRNDRYYALTVVSLTDGARHLPYPTYLGRAPQVSKTG